MNTLKDLRLNFPLWLGGNLPAYKFGADMLAWLAPDAQGAEETVPVAPVGSVFGTEEGIHARREVMKELDAAAALIRKHAPDRITVLGGDCLVDLEPFAWLSERWQEGFGILWIDTHPDVMTPEQYQNSHAHVLGALMGNGDAGLTTRVTRPVAPAKVMIAGIHSPNEYESDFIASHGINTLSPEELQQGGGKIAAWIRREGITHLAIHFDLDVLDYQLFRNVMFARTGKDAPSWDGVAKGKLSIDEALAVIQEASLAAEVVGLGIAEHLPWDTLNLKNTLAALPLPDRDARAIRLVLPQWQGGDMAGYKAGAELLAWLAPETVRPVIAVPVPEPHFPQKKENGLLGRAQLVAQQQMTHDAILQHAPDQLVMLGGDCLVDLAPFAYLSQRYGETLGILWIDTHPDVMTTKEFHQGNAQVLGALMGHGDEDLTRFVTAPVAAERVMIAGLHHPSEYEKDFLTSRQVHTLSPEELRSGAGKIAAWIKAAGITHLAVHWDLDVLDPEQFRSLTLAKPGNQITDSVQAAVGRMTLDEVTALINEAAGACNIVGFGIAEHLPWDAIHLKEMLTRLPLLS